MTVTYSRTVTEPMEGVYCAHLLGQPDHPTRLAHACLPLGEGRDLFICAACYNILQDHLVADWLATVVRGVFEK